MRWGLFVLLAVMGGGSLVQAETAVHWLVFTSWRDGNAEIYRVDSQGEQLQNITNHPAEDQHPVWSPDGTTLLFVSNRDEQWGLYRMDADGDNVQLLSVSDYEIGMPIFSPDGQQIGYNAYGNPPFGDAHFMVMSSTGEHGVELAQNAYNMVWTPDGATLFGRISGRLGFIQLDSGAQTLFEDLYVGYFAISPDGNQIAYDYGGEFSTINLLDIASGAMTVLPGISPESEVSDSRAVWSPDGTLLAYISKRSYGVFNIYITEPDPASKPRLLVPDETFLNVDPVWSPDAAQIAFVADPTKTAYEENRLEEEVFDVYVVDVNGANLVNLSQHPARDAEPAWQPLPAE